MMRHLAISPSPFSPPLFSSQRPSRAQPVYRPHAHRRPPRLSPACSTGGAMAAPHRYTAPPLLKIDIPLCRLFVFLHFPSHFHYFLLIFHLLQIAFSASAIFRFCFFVSSFRCFFFISIFSDILHFISPIIFRRCRCAIFLRRACCASILRHFPLAAVPPPVPLRHARSARCFSA